MRIIGGTHKGREILPPKQFSGRPTTDFAKEGLFNILSNQYNFEELSLLDLFAGTGSISYEFISRGGKEATAVEMNHHNVSFIRSTIERLKFEEITVVRDNVFHFIEICKKEYHLIFADPPFDLNRIESLPDKLLTANILKEDGLFILEHPSRYSFSNHPNLTNQKRYGTLNFSFFKR